VVFAKKSRVVIQNTESDYFPNCHVSEEVSLCPPLSLSRSDRARNSRIGYSHNNSKTLRKRQKPNAIIYLSFDAASRLHLSKEVAILPLISRALVAICKKPEGQRYSLKRKKSSKDKDKEQEKRKKQKKGKGKAESCHPFRSLLARHRSAQMIRPVPRPRCEDHHSLRCFFFLFPPGMPLWVWKGCMGMAPGTSTSKAAAERP
jgi:hypothetical protein